MTFAKHLKAIMATRTMTQTQLAALSGLSKASISQYLSGKTNPTESALEKIAAALDCTVDYLSIPPEAPYVSTPPADLKNLPVADAARLLGKSEQFVRVTLQRGLAPFGFATRITGNKYSYHISPKLFEEYQGGLPCITSTQETHTGMPNPVIS
ncbi:MAG: helix-turn-helix domain-containing protein [Clostridiales bacterium]|nr:helix-turn-helix domain-containing protein [Clostridiales bacterium]